MRSPVRIRVAAPDTPDTRKSVGALAFFEALCTPIKGVGSCYSRRGAGFFARRKNPVRIPHRRSASSFARRRCGYLRSVNTRACFQAPDTPDTRKSVGALAFFEALCTPKLFLNYLFYNQNSQLYNILSALSTFMTLLYRF